MSQHDDSAELVALARRMGVRPEQMADNILGPVIAEMLRVLPAATVQKAFERAAAVARAKAKATN